MTTFEIPVNYTFQTVYFVKAEDLAEAKKKIYENCGMIAGPVSCQDDKIGWATDVHPIDFEIDPQEDENE